MDSIKRIREDSNLKLRIRFRSGPRIRANSGRIRIRANSCEFQPASLNIYFRKQSTNDKQNIGAQQTARSDADINERASCQAEPEDSDDSDDSWHSIRRRKRDFNKGPQVSSAITPDICKECNLEFHQTDDEAAGFTKQGLHRPLRCLPCRQARRLRANQPNMRKPTPPTILQSKNLSHRTTEAKVSYVSVLGRDRGQEDSFNTHTNNHSGRRKIPRLQKDSPEPTQSTYITAQSSHATGIDEDNASEAYALPEDQNIHDISDREFQGAHDEFSDTHPSHEDSDKECTSLQDSEKHAPHEDSADECTSLQGHEDDKDTHVSEECTDDSKSDDLPHLQSSSTISTSPPLQVTLADFQLKDPSLLRQLERTIQSAADYIEVLHESWDWTTRTFAPVRHPYSADMASLLVRTFKYRLGKDLDKSQQERTQGS